jgi:hypothetical protein
MSLCYKHGNKQTLKAKPGTKCFCPILIGKMPLGNCSALVKVLRSITKLTYFEWNNML